MLVDVRRVFSEGVSRMSAQMRAVVLDEQGPPDVLKTRLCPVPTPGIGEVLIQVRACALNHLDIWCRSSLPGVKLPLILGCDVSGIVSELGAGVRHVKVGDRVVADPGLSCGTCRECLGGLENICRHYHWRTSSVSF